MAVLRSSSSGVGVGSTYTVSKPSGTITGDVLVAFQMGGTMTTPTGGATWQSLGTFSGTKVWWKVAGAGEPSAYTFRQAAEDEGVAAVVAIADAPAVAPRIAGTPNADDTITCPSVTTTTGGGVTFRWATGVNILDDDLRLRPPSGYTSVTSRKTPSGDVAALVAQPRTAPGSTGTANFVWIDEVPLASLGVTVDVGGVAEPPPIPTPAIPPSKDIHYRYVFCDLLTDAYITDLDLEDVSYERRIMEAGSFSATIKIPGGADGRVIAEKVGAVVPRYPADLSTGPGRTVVHVYRNGLIWGTYLIWSASIAGSERGGVEVRLQGATLESYLTHVEIRADLEYTSEDQADIARGLLSTMQGLSYANIGLTTQSGSTGVTRDITYLASEGGTFGQRLQELAELEGGFEWMIQTSDPGTGSRVREWRFGYPRIGNPSTDHVFAMPGTVISWQQDINAVAGGTSFVFRGESITDDAAEASEPTMSAPANATAHLAAGWPRLDRTLDAHSIRSDDTLDGYATRWAAERGGAVRVHQMSIRLDEWTPENLGDNARLLLINNWWPRVNGSASFDYSWRVIGVSVQATSRGSRETANVVIEEEVES